MGLSADVGEWLDARLDDIAVEECEGLWTASMSDGGFEALKGVYAEVEEAFNIIGRTLLGMHGQAAGADSFRIAHNRLDTALTMLALLMAEEKKGEAGGE